MELKWLEDFLSLQKTGNFRIAAELRNVSQPAFSRRIQALESWIEAPLFDRTYQPTQLTEAGKLFWPVAQQIVDQAQSVKSDVHTQALEDHGRMCFSTITTLAQIFIPAWLKSLQPFIDVNQFAVKTDFDEIPDYFKALEEKFVDFFICYEDPHFKFYEEESIFTSLKLGEETLVPVASPNKDRSSRFWLPDEMNTVIPCLHTISENSPSPIRRHMDAKYGSVNFKSVYESSSSPTLKAMALEGFGLAWIPLRHILTELSEGKLVRAAEPKDDISVNIQIYRCVNNDDPRIEKFWQVLLEQSSIS